VIIFLHLPRTAGSTLARIIERRYPQDGVLHLNESDFGEELAGIPPDQKNRLRVVMGHFYFGAHSFLDQPAHYITLIRDPVERTISHYYYARRSPSHHFHDTARQLSLLEFVHHCAQESSAAGIALGFCSDNDQTRQLAGKCGIPKARTSAEELLRIAKRNLTEHFAVVGVTEKFDRSLLLMKRCLGWGRPFYVSDNVNPDRARRDSLNQDTLETIRAYNELDLELYRYAEGRLENDIRSQGPEFATELQRFKRLNGTYGTLHRLASAARRGKAEQTSG
jgi:hypothetical protein